MQVLTRANPTLTPAISETKVEAWGRPGNVVVYCVRSRIMDGRKTSDE